MRIRAAEEDDAPAIAHVHVEAWRSAYRDVVPEVYLASLSPAERAGQWRDILADRSGERFVFVADDEADGVIGFAATGPERSGDQRYRGELYALYLLPLYQRQGLGRALMRAVAGQLAAGGIESMLLWVLEANAPARRFYEALGGAIVRDQPIEIGGVIFTEVAYGWPDVDVLLKAAGAQLSDPAA